MNVLALCAGGCGLELGLKLAEPGSRVVCYVEIDPYCQKLIAARIKDGYLDDAPIWDDLRTFDGRPWRGAVDCVASGFPCQPFSVAGQRKGADDERNLWPDVARVVAEVAPRYVFLENVSAVLPYYYAEIRPWLQGMGFRTAEGIFSAAEVGAPHRRERLFVLADADGSGRREYAGSGPSESAVSAAQSGSPDVADADGGGRRGWPDDERAQAPQRRRSPVSSPERPSGWEPESPFRGVAYGVAGRLGQLRALGNGVVPGVAAKAWAVLSEQLRNP